MKLKIFLLLAVLGFLFACSKNVEINNTSGFLLNVSIDGKSQGTVSNGVTKAVSVATGDHYADAYYQSAPAEGSTVYAYPKHSFNLGAFSGDYKIVYQ